ncbi:type III-B CRISPR module RAMP protein Cmr6 [Sphaerotilus sp.]|uniref:type III-B CRISPR module RAMP protein Cmr6 n=1 Tax=Sphaerotilus sp. TaxID=2093942 RepID=UPI00286EAD07|nr:type III-B CRISPR module RAMP protein Cmr6 [Sphaerotilus sp.]
MAIAAVPNYLGRDFSTASPGLRFGMYLPLWGEDRRTGELVWETKDYKYEIRGQDRIERRLPHENKVDAIRQALKLTPSDVATMRALQTRQSALALPLIDAGNLLVAEALAVAPFTTGLGNEHPLENGFAFLNPYGLPYLAGSGVKGVLRQSARELASGAWGDAQGWDDAAIDALFGHVCDDEDGLQRGALTCWDVIPQLAGDALQVEVMTAHQSHYHQQGQNPHESGSPIPINFLTVPPRSGFVFHLQCDVPFLQRIAPDLAQDRRWQVLLNAALAHAFAWLGFGAKTAVGYGAMADDPAARAQREAARRRAAAEREIEAQREAEKRMNPDDRAWAQAQPVLAAFQTTFDKARTVAFNPGGPFAQERLAFLRLALAWTESRSRLATADLIEQSATKAWGRPSNKDRWQELQAAIAALRTVAA